MEVRVLEALPWLVAAYHDLDWEWPLREAKLRDVQNRLGFLVTLCRQVAQRRGDSAAVGKLRQVEQALDRARLARGHFVPRLPVRRRAPLASAKTSRRRPPLESAHGSGFPIVALCHMTGRPNRGARSFLRSTRRSINRSRCTASAPSPLPCCMVSRARLSTVDCFAVILVEKSARLLSLAGEGSALHKKYGQAVGIILTGLEGDDLALSKLERNSARENRYHSELRPYLANQERHDLTLRLWLEMLRGS
jgi:hypothetical protein